MWGWHRLADGWAASVVAAAGIEPGDIVVDVGAGDGALTVHLLAAGAQVIAVELHPGRREALRHRFSELPVVVVNADASRMRWPRRRFKVVANPPYAATVALVRQLLSPHVRCESADLVLQRRMVRTLIERPPTRLAGTGCELTLERGLRVPRWAFQPPVAVDSAVLRIRRKAR
ncbi:MAG: rRNA adenine N-6-methyltransferase family protein [Nocardioidaceae bacterium]